MSTGHRIAALVCGRRTKWLVLVFWLIVVAVAGPLAGKLMGAENNDSSSWLPGNAESTKVLILQNQFQEPDTAPAIVVYERPGGLTPADRAKAAADAQNFHGVPSVTAVIGPIALDNEALVTQARIHFGPGGWNNISTAVDKIRANIGTPPGLNIHIAGPAGVAADSSKAFKGIDSTLLFATLAVVIGILLLTYRGPALWLLPVISAGTALTSAQALIYVLAKHAGLTVNAQSAGILLVLVFGAGTDYALLLVARYREELRRHEDRHEAMALALHRAGPAILASASTVALGMLCLLVAEMNSTRGLGPVLALGIVVSLFAMLTLLPALLVIVGRWVFWPVIPRFGSVEPTEHGFWARVGRRVARRPRVVWIVTALLLGALAIGLTDLHTGVLSTKDSFTKTQDSVVGLQVLARHHAAGSGQPIVVIGTATAADQLRSTLAATAGIDPKTVTQPLVKNGLAYLEATPTDPPDSPAAQVTVDRVRAGLHAIPDANARVGGGTAVQLDTARATSHDLKLIMPLILLVVLVILGLLLRAIVAPVLLVATVVLSFASALGVSALIFDHLFHFAGEDTSLPLFVFVFLVALGIDYNIFLMTRVREEATRHGTRRGALTALGATGGVITSAGLVLAGTFAVLATLPLVAFAEIGFAVAFGVLLDTLIVRSVLVTALNLDIGPRMWWPNGLAAQHEPAAAEVAREEEEPALVS